MGKTSKWIVTVIVVSAIVMIVTGVVGASMTFPSPKERQPSYPFEQQETVAGDAFDSVKIEGGTMALQVSGAAVDQAQIRLTGELYQAPADIDDFIEVRISNGELRITFAREILMNELIVFGLEASDVTDAMLAEIVLPEKMYSSLEIRSLTGEVSVRGIEAEMVDIESVTGDIRLATSQDPTQLSVSAQSDHGTVTVFGQQVKSERGSRYDHEAWHDEDDWDEGSRINGSGQRWIELESEHGSIEVEQMN